MMAVIANTSSPNIPHIPGGMLPQTSTAFAANSLVDLVFASAYISPSTSSSTTHTIFGVFTDKALTTAGSNPVNVDVTPIMPGPTHLYIVDCTNNTAANQLYARQALSNSTTLNNTSSDVSGNTGVFLPIAMVGAASNKQLLGYFLNIAPTN